MAEDTTETAAPRDPLAEWTAILDDLEASIFMAFAGEDPEWLAPPDPGPIPSELHGRALRVLDAQREAEMVLAGQRVIVSRHLGAVSAIPVQAPQRSGRLDVSA